MAWKGDPHAFHDDVDGEIDGLTEKVTPVAADLVIINDSEDGNSVKSAQAGNLPGGGGGGTELTTKGDLHGYDTDDARIPVGADGEVLTADSGEALGMKWAASADSGSYAETIGDNSATSFQVTHSLDTQDLVVQLWDLTGAEPVEATGDASQIEIDDDDNITVTFGSAPATDAYRVVVLSSGGEAGGGGGGGATRTLEFEDDTDDASLVTVAAGTAAYDATEDAIKVDANSRIYYAQADAQLANLGDWYDVEMDVKPDAAGALVNMLTAYDNSGWDAYLFRIDYRTGGRFYGFLRANGGSWGDAGGPQLRGPQTSGSHQGTGWIPVVFGRRGDIWFMGLRVLHSFSPMMLTFNSHTEYTSGSGVGVHAENVGVAIYYRNVRAYSYASDPTVP